MKLVLRREENVFPSNVLYHGGGGGGGKPSVIKCEMGGRGLIPEKGVMSYLNAP